MLCINLESGIVLEHNMTHKLPKKKGSVKCPSCLIPAGVVASVKGNHLAALGRSILCGEANKDENYAVALRLSRGHDCGVSSQC